MESIKLVTLFCNARTGHFGAGAHMEELLYYVRNDPRINLTIVSTDDQTVDEVTSQVSGGESILRIPMPRNGLYLTAENSDIQLVYAKRISELVIEFIYSDINSQIVFLVNSCDFLNVCRSIKDQILCQLVYVHHSWGWKTCFNVPDLEIKRIISSAESDRDSSTEVLRRSVRRLLSFQEEIAKLADHVVTVTNQARAFFVEILGFDERKITTIYNGVNFAKFAPVDKKVARAQLNISPSDKIILYVGRIKHDKGIGVLIDAFKELRGDDHNIKLIIVGGGDFKEFVRRSFPYFNSVFFTGELDRASIQAFYCAADIGVIPSLHEQCSFTAIEMRFFGLPLIVTAVDGLNEMFEQDVDAIKVSCTLDKAGFKSVAIHQLAAAIDSILQDPELGSRLAGASRRRAFSNFTGAKMYDGYVSVLTRLFSTELVN